MRKLTERQREAMEGLAFQLMHGADLVAQGLDAAASPGEYTAVYRRYPELGAAHERAEDALEEMYQTAGRVWGSLAGDKP